MTEYLNEQLSREDIQMENEHMRQCSATVHFAEEQEFPMICCEYYILQTFSKTLWISYKIKYVPIALLVRLGILVP